MHIHILGICGTFMGGLALLARELGMTVSGSDANVYPPMSDQLAAAGINVSEGYEPKYLQPEPDLVVMGNAMTRGNPAVEYVLNKGLPYVSGPQWLSQHVLQGRWVLAVSGTHGKTTTSSLLAWILEHAGMSPGFLIGGVPDNFGETARLGKTPFFVIEADEYDTAFFDKRSKFVHYLARTLVINNLEFDHADIFDDLAAIQKQFHHLIRTVPSEGLIISPQEKAIEQVLAMGCWTPRQSLGNESDWQATLLKNDGSEFEVSFAGKTGTVNWSMLGQHNVNNALAAIAAAHHVGVTVAHACEALSAFAGVKRRLELRGEVDNIRVYDDFAHHPTAIATTIAGLRAKIGNKKLVAVLEPRSNTMKMGVHQDALAQSLIQADRVLLLQDSDLKWSLKQVTDELGDHVSVFDSIDTIVKTLQTEAQQGDEIVVMSNGGFGGIHQRILDALEQR
ncbi:UDP-N-acetylmuramate:L-alanyl-gamma-D-glutamyl-meso-diaminopimelate ligase [Methylophaga thiooxydans]|uniref:UDP-N-acetylmuramate--L-alanyl-gamma-D-glutamyl-meso-2,6-diaminoheptandioate ligase n=1 Tax=Methylophaga thiooxydans DMS010 TaxID=637616 RepID=C0N4C8_9GAMM|nr:UDP-N-acetylmuramate:L-alanyl-gamma-D-glutamyl-meso-diaminopimelate ligase [Methylophaga thiooxydans]EEF80383.1 UDP-N-acetylmuramate:L-alanyl-gamma-D-glutamyl-meso-diaminopimelate ligase [Methylophaga thiooxydans DMS010]